MLVSCGEEEACESVHDGRVSLSLTVCSVVIRGYRGCQRWEREYADGFRCGFCDEKYGETQ